MTAFPLHTSRLRGAGESLGRESLPIVVCAAFVGVAAILVPDQLSPDGWLALVAGRLIAHDGIPHHDTLAALTAGREWIDQQWLGQLALYALVVAGGLRALVAANVVLVAGGFVAACVFARRRGGHPTTVGVVALLALLPLVAATLTVRTQSLVYVPFVLLVAFLARERLTTSSVLVLLGVLVIWANVHGSALLAGGLIVLRGAAALYESRRVGTSGRAAWLALLGPIPCLFASPYHLHLVSYYGTTALNPSFGKYLAQWAPTRFSPIAAPLLLLLFGSVWMLGRAGRAYSLYERCVLVVAVLLGLTAVRQWAFSGLLLVGLAPVGFDQAFRRRPPRAAPVLGTVIALVAGVAAVVGTVDALSAPHADLARNYPARAADATVRAAGSGRTVYAAEEFADWLLWEHPELAGRVAFDVRYELLDQPEVRRIVLFDAGSGLGDPLTRPGVFILDPKRVRHAVDGLRATVRTVYKTDHAVVVVPRNAG